MGKVEGILLDLREEVKLVGGVNRTVMRLFLKGKKSEVVEVTDFEPFFYVIPSKKASVSKLRKDVEHVKGVVKDGEVSPSRVEVVKSKYLGKELEALKVFCYCSKDLMAVREAIKNWDGVDTTSSFLVSTENKFLYSRGLVPTDGVECVVEKGKVKSLKAKPGSSLKGLVLAAFDLEVFAKHELPNPESNEVLTISYVTSTGVKKVFATKKIKEKFVVACKSEKEMFERFAEQVRIDDPDVLMTYGGDRFDFPYLKKRAKKLKCKLVFGRDGSEISIRPGSVPRAKVAGRIHLDVYHLIRFLATIGVINLPRYKLERVYEHVFGKKKLELPGDKIWKFWEKDPEKLARYNLEDSEAALGLGVEFLPTFVELSRLAGIPLYNASRVSTGTIVELYLLKRAEELGEISPRRPKNDDVKDRLLNPFQGAYVMEPEPGLKENIVEYDYRALYPTIIISHNISPETLEVKGCKDFHESPTGAKFCKKPVGFVPLVLEDLLDARVKVKKEMNKLEKGSVKFQGLYAKQYALKIVANSMYGYLGFPRSRWYSRECAESITSWARDYIKKTIKQAEVFGFKPLYADTDSLYAEIPKGWGDKKLKEFLKEVNDKLPSKMELELEGLYSRGLFVATKQGARGAKKKYALIDKAGNIKIRGFEFVRRDWAGIAKDTQMLVLKHVLKKGNEKEAVKLVKDVIERLRKKDVELKDLVIHTQIKRKLDDYSAIGPHVAAARKAEAHGWEFKPGSTIDFVITAKGKSISDKAKAVHFVEEGDYDVDYYINNQVVPSAMRILSALGYDSDKLLHDGEQKNLDKWFKK